jgi:hypothetical protein
MFALPSMVVESFHGTLGIHASGSGVAWARSDLLLQTYEGVSSGRLADLLNDFDLPPKYFDPSLFEPQFTVSDLPIGTITLPKSVVVLSVLPDISRTIYRHRRTGILIDPGSAWLRTSGTGSLKPGVLSRFKESFTSQGRISPEGFAENLTRLVPLIRRRTGAQVLVFNSLEIDPGDLTFDYSLRNLDSASRRRRFNILLQELRPDLGFHIIDVDQILKDAGISKQVDFSHFPIEQMRAIAAGALRTLHGLEIL